MSFDSPVKEYPFTLHVPDADLDLLRRKLELAHLPDELQVRAESQWNYGVPLADVKRLVFRWKVGFDWRKFEAEINKLPMYTRDIFIDNFGSLNIHYVHRRSDVLDAIPLLFVHGWPGHFLEVRKLLPLLTEESVDHPSFHVVAVSLPGFAFSEAPTKPGFGAAQYAEVFNKLMISLGYEEYVYQGGDWGHVVLNLYGGRHVKAWHTNCPMTTPKLSTVLAHPSLIPRLFALPFDKDARDAIALTKKHFAVGCGYMIEQATRPQTLGYSLADSPVGLLAWIYEKLVTWSDEYPWTDDEVLEWVSIYWFSRAGPAASLRIYYEMSHGRTRDFFDGTQWIPIPTGVSYFPREIARLPKSWARFLGNVVYQGEHSQGGHFAAHEAPEKLAYDLRRMYGRDGPAFGVVPSRSGYMQR
ncbi:alpha/beta-hydrolase [Lentinus tigrinus ALCF2SS1-7]|uniref:alpha/beta-hydrolase n=1 Tax=Lentinus tigrinus ALCF2SS1-7 TaxID=1328758 RepID=UPI00116629FB|nr:alpha/beta-hydrolase [Lentinus tigrinus ALCF2SS1-7]